MAYTYRGIKATWNYSKNCWVISYNGDTYYCLDDEVNDTINEILSR